MDAPSLNEMTRLVKLHLGDRWGDRLKVLDVGSRDVNGTYDSALSDRWEFTGADIVPGPHVHMLQPGPYTIPAPDCEYNLVICGQVLEHVDRPWRLVPEMARVLALGGLMILAAPWQWPPHDHPCDYWRLLPGAMDVLIRDAGVDRVDIHTVGPLTWAVARKTSHNRQPPRTAGGQP